MRTVICIPVIIIFVYSNISAQSKTIDSLKQVLQNEKEDTNRVNTLNELSHQFIKDNDYTNSASFANAALKLTQKINFKKGKATSYVNLGDLNSIQANDGKAIEYYYVALKLFEEMGDKQSIGDLHQWLGDAYQVEGNYEEALKNLFASLNVKYQINDKAGIAQSYNTIGEIYFNEGNDTDAMKKYYDALKIYEALGNKVPNYGFASSYVRIGVVYQNQGYSASQEGNKAIANDRFSKALQMYFKSLKLFEKTSNKTAIADMYSLIGNLYILLKNFSVGKSYLERGLQIYMVVGDKRRVANAYMALSNLEKTKRNYKQALEYFTISILYRDSASYQENATKSLQSKLQYEFDKKEDSIKAADDKKAALANAEIQNQKTIRNFSYAGSIAVLSFAGVGFYRYRRRRKLQSQQEMLNERLRISRELHDDIGSTLGSISIYSEVAKNRSEKNENAKEAIAKIGNASRELIDKMSDIVWSINPNNETFEQLLNRIQVFAAIMLTPHEILYTIDRDEKAKHLKLTSEERKNIYLIYKETVHNIIKYAACTQVEIKMLLNAGEFTMSIKDNGKGFDINQLQNTDGSLGGNGIKNMKNRAESINADFNIHSIIDTGTILELKLKV